MVRIADCFYEIGGALRRTLSSLIVSGNLSPCEDNRPVYFQIAVCFSIGHHKIDQSSGFEEPVEVVAVNVVHILDGELISLRQFRNASLQSTLNGVSSEIVCRIKSAILQKDTGIC